MCFLNSSMVICSIFLLVMLHLDILIQPVNYTVLASKIVKKPTLGASILLKHRPLQPRGAPTGAQNGMLVGAILIYSLMVLYLGARSLYPITTI
uniref:Uncharacterized protein n=1 Tax=Arundo donax TaxID=35708 RepID=A0A0A9CTV7_ARUDO